MKKAKAAIQDLPPSFSSLGKMCDISVRKNFSGSDSAAHDGADHRQEGGYGSGGGQAGAAARPDVKPWDGMEMIDQVLNEANPTAVGVSVRGATAVSSPRVNPALVQKDISETTTSKTVEFLNNTSRALGRNVSLPERMRLAMESGDRSVIKVKRDIAQNAADRADDDDGGDGGQGGDVVAVEQQQASSPLKGAGSPKKVTPPQPGNTSTGAASPSLLAAAVAATKKNTNGKQQQHQPKKKKHIHSSAFLGPKRPAPGDELRHRGPDVGKYQPKFTAVERDVSTPHIQIHHHHHHPSRHHAGSRQASRPYSQQSHGNLPSPGATMSGVGDATSNNLFATEVGDVTISGLSKSMNNTSFALSGSAGQSLGQSASIRFGQTQKGGTSSNLGATMTMGATMTAGLATTVRGQQQQGAPEEPKVWRKHDVRDCSSAFKSAVKREQPPAFSDLDYGPYPLPGTTTYTAGKIRGNARERSYTPFGNPCGPNIDYEVPDHQRPKSTPDFDRVVGRDLHKSRATYTKSVDTAALDYSDADVSKLSTKKRLPTPIEMHKQATRPPPRVPLATEPVDLYHDSVLTRKKQGFVEIARMQDRNKIPFAEEANAPQQSIDPQYDFTHRRSPMCVISAKGGRDSPAGLGSQSTSTIYDANDEGVRRHRPTPYFPRTTRESPVMRVASPADGLNDHVYDVKDDHHVAHPKFSHQVSRDKREKRYAPPNACADVVYDVTSQFRPRNVVAFASLKARE